MDLRVTMLHIDIPKEVRKGKSSRYINRKIFTSEFLFLYETKYYLKNISSRFQDSHFSIGDPAQMKLFPASIDPKHGCAVTMTTAKVAPSSPVPRSIPQLFFLQDNYLIPQRQTIQ